MSPPSKHRTRSQQDRQSSQELLNVYGSLLTPKQYSMTAGYCNEGKSFSQIAREQGVSRQAVHEAVRGVQRLLRYYEEKLQLASYSKTASRQGTQSPSAPPSCAAVTDAVERLESLGSQIKRKGIIYTPDWIVQEINAAIRILEEEVSYSSGKQAAEPGEPAPARRSVKR